MTNCKVFVDGELKHAMKVERGEPFTLDFKAKAIDTKFHNIQVVYEP